MPVRLRFALDGPTPRSPFEHARGLHALVLAWIQAASPETAQALHDANQPKPFAIGPLRADGNGRLDVCHFDVAAVADWLEPLLLDGAASHDGPVILGDAAYRLLTRGERVDAVTWEDLLDSPPQTRWTIRLTTPTAHHALGELRKALPTPTPENYFGGWLTRWDLSAPIAFPRELLDVVEHQVAVSHLAGETLRVTFGRGRTHIGFVGRVTFDALRPTTIPPEALARLTALARFSAYCGTGVSTSYGLGQTGIE